MVTIQQPIRLTDSDVGDRRPSVAVLIPCLNEDRAIAKVVTDFRAALPGSTIFVYDNGSTDNTVKVALASGAIVRQQPLKGKGNVVRQMFADVEADVYVLVDGDDTYDASAAPAIVERLLRESADMVNASRVSDEVAAYRTGHRFGNVLLTSLVAWFFGDRIRDLLSGYRAFSRRFVKSFPAQSAGFEIETELSVHALQLRMPIAEISTAYKERAEGTQSKLSTYRDGWRILRTIAFLVREEKPLAFFSWVAAVTFLLGIVLGMPVVFEYLSTGLVPRLPTALLATALVLLSFLSFTCGLILDSVSRTRTDIRRLAYLSVSVRFPR